MLAKPVFSFPCVYSQIHSHCRADAGSKLTTGPRHFIPKLCGPFPKTVFRIWLRSSSQQLSTLATAAKSLGNMRTPALKQAGHLVSRVSLYLPLHAEFRSLLRTF